MKTETELRPEINKMIKAGCVVITGLALLMLFWANNPIVSVPVGYVGILTEFGEIRTVMEPGLHFKVPVIQGVDMVSVQINKYEEGTGAASKDLQVVHTTVAVNYRIENTESGVRGIWQQFRGAHEERIIAPLVAEIVKANTAKYTAEELITRREMVKAAIESDLRERLAQYGIVVSAVSITNFDFSSQFNQAIESKVVVEQERQRAELSLEKRRIEVQQGVVEAEASAQIQIINATAYANATITRANADAKAITTISNSMQENYLQYYALDKWDGRVPMVSGNQGLLIGSDLLNRSG